MRIRQWAWAVVLAGCTAKDRPTTTPPTPVSEAQEETADPELWAVADAVDPGPQKPLFDALPAWLRGKFGATPEREVAVREIREALLAWDKMRPSSGQDLMTSLLSLGRGLILAEQAVAGGVDDPELLLALSRAYAILGNPAFASEQGMFQQILQFAAMAMAQARTDGSVDMASVVTGLREVFKRAPPLHRRTAAELLRRHGEHPEVPRVLGRLADDDLWNERFHGALKLRQMSLARLGKAAKGGDHLDLAWTCYKALDPGCGDAALARGKALGTDKPDDAKAVAAFATRVETISKLGETARQVQALTADPRVNDPKHADLVPALARGHKLILLGHYGDARAQYEALKDAHPEDARPYAGLAKAAISQAGSMTEAARFVAAGRRLKNRDQDFFEVALGVFGTTLITDVLPAVLRQEEGKKLDPVRVMTPLLDDMKEYAAGLQAFDPARGGVVLDLEAVMRAVMPLLEQRTDEIGPVAARELTGRTKALVEKFPGSPDVRRLAHLTANLTPDRALALALVRAPLVGELANDEAMQRARVQVWLDVALLWDAAEEVPAVLAAARALPAKGGWQRDVLEGLALALHVRATKDRGAAQAAVRLFEGVAAAGEAADKVKLAAVCNAAALLAWIGEADAAKERYELILAKDPKSMAALVGLAGLYTTHGVHEPKLMEIFELAAREGDNATLRLQAQAWRYTQAKAGFGDVEVTRQGFVDMVNKTGGDIRGNLPVGKLGAYSSGDWNLSLQYQATVGFSIINTLNTTGFLMLTSPDTDELVAAAAEAKKKAGKDGKSRPAKTKL